MPVTFPTCILHDITSLPSLSSHVFTADMHGVARPHDQKLCSTLHTYTNFLPAPFFVWIVEMGVWVSQHCKMSFDCLVLDARKLAV